MEQNKVGTLVGGTLILKKWEECSIEERVEKLRQEVKDFRYIYNRISSLENTMRELTNHTHDTLGQAVTKIDPDRSMRNQNCSTLDRLA